LANPGLNNRRGHLAAPALDSAFIDNLILFGRRVPGAPPASDFKEQLPENE